MIMYNHRYRGQFEYDKFALNILSFHNIVTNLETLEIQGTNEEISSLLSIHDEVNKIFNDFTGNGGLCETSFLFSIKERECINL